MHAARRKDYRRLIPALVAAAVAATPVAVVNIQLPNLALRPIFMCWWACFVAFIAALVAAERWSGDRRRVVAMLIAESLLGLTANWLIPMAIEGVALTGILLVVVAGGMDMLPRRVAIGWILCQSAATAAMYAWRWPLLIAFAAGGAYWAMQMVVYSATALARSEREKRIALESTLRELVSTRTMLDEAVRSAERSEFARDLHDVVGHHLVALGLQLDAAGESDSPREHLADARRLVRLLLADIREVVADLRQESGVDLRRSLLSLATEGPGPRVVVEVGDDVPTIPSGLAQTILRCVQEAVTNARKHASATTVQITLDAHRVAVTDDGRGISTGSGGVGHEVMRERCGAAGCALRIDSRPTIGTTITIDFAKGAAS